MGCRDRILIGHVQGKFLMTGCPIVPDPKVNFLKNETLNKAKDNTGIQSFALQMLSLQQHIISPEHQQE